MIIKTIVNKEIKVSFSLALGMALLKCHMDQFWELYFFNTFINNLFLLQIKSEIRIFTDDNTLYGCHKDLRILSNLEYDMTNAMIS